jgi:hypothetical protein
MAAPQIDVESARDEKEYLHGFADFSHFIASDFSLSIYRKFATLEGAEYFVSPSRIAIIGDTT